jgi:hypothetical protein
MLEGLELTVHSEDLDFTSTKHFFWKLVSGEVAFNSSSWLELIQAGAPEVTQNSCSIQEIIDKALHEASSTLILTTFHAICDPHVLLIVVLVWLRLFTQSSVSLGLSAHARFTRKYCRPSAD